MTCSRGNPYQPVQSTHPHYHILHLHASQTGYLTMEIPMQPSIGIPNETEPPNLPSFPTSASAQTMQDRAGRLAATLGLGLYGIEVYISLPNFFLHAWRNRAHALHVHDALWACCRPGHAWLQDFLGKMFQSRVPPNAWRA